MEPFDKSFYDIAASDLQELWDSDMEQGVCDYRESDEEWSESGSGSVGRGVILHDRLMSDALLGIETPIKNEHSYCSMPNDGSRSVSPLLKTEMETDDEDEDESYMKAVSPTGEAPLSVVVVKTEPASPRPSASPSPPPAQAQARLTQTTPIIFETKNFGQSILKPPIVINSKTHTMKRKQLVMQNTIKIEANNNANFMLPPTPPSSTSSDSEGSVSPLHSSSPSKRLFLSANTQARQPINTPLISSQPKGTTGILFLTEEEKRTLLAEGYPIPMRLPLTKAEEKSLKKVRRKIKNKISAQESRRKKKEYMDALERKVQLLSSENLDFRKKITSLEDANSNLINQLNKVQAIIARSHGGLIARNFHK